MATTVHLVYALPGTLPHTTRLHARLARELAFLGLEPPWRGGHLEIPGAAVHAPLSISVNLLRYFARHYPVRFYGLDEERALIDVGPDDILIGHTSARNGPLNRFLRSGRPALASIILQPFAFRLDERPTGFLDLLRRCDAFAAITGPYWIDHLQASPYAAQAAKFTRLDLAVDAAHYPLVKTGFNPRGSRGLLYIGHNRDAYKGCASLSTLARLLPETRFGWIGDGAEIPGVTHLSSARALTPEYMRGIWRDYDFFITMGTADPNPTTVLEAMAWGAPVLCTPQSGYYQMDAVLTVTHQDMVANVALIHQLQELPEQDLLALSRRNRALVEQHYTWDRFTRTVQAVIDGVAARRQATVAGSR